MLHPLLNAHQIQMRQNTVHVLVNYFLITQI
jgi:DNA mismatch repair ATPase MutS